LLWSGFDLGDYGDNFYPATYFEFSLKPRDLNNLENILNTKRFSELKVLGIPILDKNFLALIRQHPNIRCLEFAEVDVGLDKDDFADVLVTLESIKFFGKDDLDDDYDDDKNTCENKEQLMALFKKMLDDEGKASKLKKLVFDCGDFSSIDSNVLVKGLNQLEELELLDAYTMTSEQTSAFFSTCAVKTKLRKIRFQSWNLEKVDPELIALVFGRMEKVEFDAGVKNENNQLERLLESLDAETKLKDLRVFGYISSVDPDILALGVNQLEKVDLSSTNLTSTQIKKLINQTLKKSKLKYLDISQNENVQDFYKEVAEVRKKVSVVKSKYVRYVYSDESDDNDYSDDNNYSFDFDYSDTDDYSDGYDYSDDDNYCNNSQCPNH